MRQIQKGHSEKKSAIAVMHLNWFISSLNKLTHLGQKGQLAGWLLIGQEHLAPKIISSEKKLKRVL